MEDVEKVFNAQAKSVERVMGEQNRGFYVPSYQRPYAWDRENMSALITNICEGIRTLEQMSDAITFIGTFIFIHDTNYTTVEPQVRGDLPGAVYLVIDGQQRLTTLATISVCLHNMIRSVHAKIKYPNEASDKWSRRHVEELTSRLENVFAIDKHFGEGHNRWYPRIIRAHDDTWSLSERQARYTSAVASLLSSYIRWWRGGTLVAEGDEFDWEPPSDSPHYERLRRNQSLLTSMLGKISRGEESFDIPPLHDIAASSDQQRRFFLHDVPTDVCDLWRQPDPTLHVRRLMQLSRLCLFTRYFLDRVAVTQVLVNKEEYAFDLFEALNTTGEPLTAYETFKPTVIKQEGLDLYNQTPSASAMTIVERYLEQNADKRKQASDRLLIPFALFERGYRLGKHLREQRNWLRQSYDAASDRAAKREFVQGMAAVATFLMEWWPERSQSVAPADLTLGTAESTALLCINALRAAKHDITVPLLARFHHAALTASPATHASAVTEFVEVLKAVTAMFVLWRGTRPGTENIDAVYRALMSKIEDGRGPFKRIGGVSDLRSSDVKHLLRRQLIVAGVSDLTSFVHKAVGLAVYAQSEILTKLILLAASHDAVPDPNHPGFAVSGRPGVCPMLTMEVWRRAYEVEHVAPQRTREHPSDGSGWPGELYSRDLVDTLGNLTLLPRSENASAGNRAWAEKLLYYQILGCESLAAAETLLQQAGSRGIVLPAPTQDILREASYLPHLRSIAQLPEQPGWTVELVNRRSAHLAERAYRQFAPWLGMTHEESNPAGAQV